MTAACPGGGTSQPKLTTEAVVGLASGYLAQLLESAGQPELLPLVPLLVLPSIVTSHFCGGDPPAMVALTQAESDALLNLNFGPDFSSGLPKVSNIILNQLWNDLCECSSGAPTLPTPPALPPNTVVTLGPQPGANQACAVFPLATDGSTGPCGRQFGPSASFVAIHTGGSPPAGAIPTAASIDWTFYPNPGPTPPFTMTWRFTAQGLTEIDRAVNVPAGTTTFSNVQTWPAGGYTGVSVRVDFGATGGVVDACAPLSLWCNGTLPNGTQQPCCPPDTATQTTLDAILKMVTLIQRYHVPFAYQLGAVHSGLPQQGSFIVSGLLGLKLDVVQTIDSRPVLPGTPPYYWDQGWCSVMDGNGFIQETRLTRQSQVWFPTIMQDATTVGWWLEPNTQLTITEIEAEI